MGISDNLDRRVHGTSFSTGNGSWRMTADNARRALASLNEFLARKEDLPAFDTVTDALETVTQSEWTVYDASDGSITGLDILDCTWAERHDRMMEVLAPFVETGSHLRLLAEDSDSDWLGVAVRFDGERATMHDIHRWSYESGCREDMLEMFDFAVEQALRLGANADEMIAAIRNAAVKEIMED